MNKKKLLIVALAFCLGSTLFVAIPALGVSSPPFDLYAAVRDIQNKVNLILGASTNTQTQLSALQNALTDMDMKLWSGSDSIMNMIGTLGTNVELIANTLSTGGDFYTSVSNWIWNLDQKITNVENKVDRIDQKISSEKPGLQVVYAKYGEIITDKAGAKIVLRVRTNCTCQVTLTVCTHFYNDDRDEIDVYTDHSGWQYPIYKETGSDWSDQYYADSMTFAANSTQIQIYNAVPGSTSVSFQIIAMGPPNTIVTQFYTDFPANVTSSYP